MKIDLLHNKIVKDTMTEAFKESFLNNLIPMLEDTYGSEISAVQMYEDYLGDGFVLDGEFYYPLSVILSGDVKRVWIKWGVSEKKLFALGVPFSYVGKEPLGFSLVESVPDGFEEKLVGRGIYFEDEFLPINIDSPVTDKTFLVGKYSQTFIDEMARQINREIVKSFSVSGLCESGVELLLVFAPNTYMEHKLDKITYRRLLISARACSARDLWIKWFSKDGIESYSVSDNVDFNDVTFLIGEDVPQKIGEKEYRFLVHTSSEKYQAAMGRKNITEWRDMIKRVIKRGELTKVDVAPEDPARDSEIASKLQEVLGTYSAPVSEKAPDVSNGDINELLKSVLGMSSEEEVAPEIPESAAEEPVTEPEEILEEKTEEKAEAPVAEDKPSEPVILDEAALRRKIEAEIREQLANEARMKAEAEAEELRRAHDELKAENERLMELARKAEADSAAEAERLRTELESRERAEARERERMAEAARLALIEQQRLAEENRVKEAEEARIRAEEEKAAEEARILAEKKAEEERIQAEIEKAKEEARLEAERKAELERLAEEERRKAEEIKYISKNARLLFKRPVDPNVTKRIHEIILSTIRYFHKENVFIKIKATVPDATTVNLNFVKIPESEQELLVNIIKVLGRSELGITKVILE